MESQLLLKRVIKNQKRILHTVKKIDKKCDQILMLMALEESNKCKKKLVGNIKLIENVLNTLSPSPNESHVEQQSPGNYDPSELMEELDDFVKNYQPDFLEVRENDALNYYNTEVPDEGQRNSKEPSNKEGKINEKPAFD